MNNSISPNIRISLRDVLFIVFSKIHVLKGTLIFIVALTVGSAFIFSPVYETSSTVIIKPYVDSSLQLQTFIRLQAIPVTQEDINSEMRIMGSEELLRRVVKVLQWDVPPPVSDNFFIRIANKIRGAINEALIFLTFFTRGDPTDIAVNALRESLNIEPVTMSNMIRVSMRGKDPEEITRTVNTFLDYYIDYHIEVHKPKGGIEFYSHQAEFYNKKLTKAENALQRFQKKNSIIEIQSERVANLELMNLLKQSLSVISGKIITNHSKLSQLKKNLKSTGMFSAITEELRTNPVIVEMTKAMIPLLVEAERIALLYPESSVEYQDAFNQIERFRKEIKQEQEKILNGIAFDLVALKNQEKSILSEIKNIELKTRFLTEKETEMDKLTREIFILKKNYLLYQDKTEEARISDQKDASRVANISVANWSHVPSTPVFPKKMLMALISIFMGLVMGIGASFAAYYLDHTVKRPEDIDINCEIPVLSSLGNVESSDE